MNIFVRKGTSSEIQSPTAIFFFQRFHQIPTSKKWLLLLSLTLRGFYLSDAITTYNRHFTHPFIYYFTCIVWSEAQIHVSIINSPPILLYCFSPLLTFFIIIPPQHLYLFSPPLPIYFPPPLSISSLHLTHFLFSILYLFSSLELSFISFPLPYLFLFHLP